jgi:hypothetical protein
MVRCEQALVLLEHGGDVVRARRTLTEAGGLDAGHAQHAHGVADRGAEPDPRRQPGEWRRHCPLPYREREGFVGERAELDVAGSLDAGLGHGHEREVGGDALERHRLPADPPAGAARQREQQLAAPAQVGAHEPLPRCGMGASDVSEGGQRAAGGHAHGY